MEDFTVFPPREKERCEKIQPEEEKASPLATFAHLPVSESFPSPRGVKGDITAFQKTKRLRTLERWRNGKKDLALSGAVIQYSIFLFSPILAFGEPEIWGFILIRRI
jgi:hypothetical protein